MKEDWPGAGCFPGDTALPAAEQLREGQAANQQVVQQPCQQVLPSVLVNMEVARMAKEDKREVGQQLVKRTQNYQLKNAWRYNPTCVLLSG